jgi:peptide/nickel transport system ATP-binding protein
VIARALAVEPRLIVLDEPTSALDVTVQARILDLIARLRAERGLAYLLISHNLAVVDRLCEESVVLFRGGVVERGPTPLLLDRPAHPYTQELRASVRELGVAPSHRVTRATAEAPPTVGCRFAHRCPLAIDRCRAEAPALRTLDDGRGAACHRAEDALARESVAS